MKKSNLLVIALMSVTLIAMELAWTRIFSAEFFYTFAFLILSLAVLGLGLGALALHLWPALDREHSLGILLSAAGLTALAGPPAVFHLGLKFSELLDRWSMVGRLGLTIILLSSAFFFGGVALAMIFKKNCNDMPRLYMADLVGAGLGVAFAVLLMNYLGTPVATFLSTLPILAAAVLVSRRWLKAVPVGLMAVAITLCTFADTLLEVEREERAPVVYKHWDAMSKIKVFDFDGDYRGINVDNVANSPVYPFDGDWDRSERFEFGIDVSYLIGRFESCTFLSLGAGGGTDVLQALQAGAAEIHAVEVNPHVNELMLDGELAEYSGRIYQDPRVEVVTEDARAYVRRHQNKFDVIYSLSSNTWAALGSGAFALAENYLFTTEAFQDYWEALSEQGFMMMEHQFYMPRLVSEVLDAFEELGVSDVEAHLAIYDLPQMRRKILLLSKRPLTDEIRRHAFGELTAENFDAIHLLYPAPDSLQDNPVNKIIRNGWRSVAAQSPVAISPCTDDRPFVAQMGLWKNAFPDNPERLLPYEFLGFPLSKWIIVVILLVILILVVPLNLVPYFMKAERLRAIPWLYFFAIGMAFMAVEVILIQKYTLLIGPSIYSIVVILLALLISSGIGSRFARRFTNSTIFAAIVAWLLLDVFVFRYLIYALGDFTMWPRILLTGLLIAPLGFFMGMPFPKGALRVGALVDWGFAVNGAASVLGSTVIILIAFTFGFSAALLVGAFLYLAAFMLISRRTSW
ncbi:MAG: hypothetical protein GY856_12430 [bacterium]|nr:hypothetical protein [bacterium]